jgi:hypothetical protein
MEVQPRYSTRGTTEVIRATAVLAVASLFALDPNPSLCGSPGGDDGGAGGSGSSSSGSGANSNTIAAQCNAIVNEFCTQAVARCALAGFTVSDCVSADMSQCCSTGNTCDAKSSDPQSAVDTCKGDIDTEDCNFIVNSTLPPSCQALLHP